MKLKNPLVASASPLSRSWIPCAGLKMPEHRRSLCISLFEEQVTNEAESMEFYKSYGTESYAEALTYFPGYRRLSILLRKNIWEIVAQSSEQIGFRLLPASTASHPGGWISYAKKMAEAGPRRWN